LNVKKLQLPKKKPKRDFFVYKFFVIKIKQRTGLYLQMISNEAAFFCKAFAFMGLQRTPLPLE